MGARIALMFAMVLAACGESSTDVVDIARGDLALDCAVAGSVLLSGGGACVQVLDFTPDYDEEAHIAVNPRDPDEVLVTWRENFPPRSTIFAAMTTNRGVQWIPAELRNPASLPLPQTPFDVRWGVDSTAAFGPDGTAYVLYAGDDYGVREGVILTESFRMSLAASRDHGVTWTYHTVFEEAPLGTPVPDFPDLAVAPDTGHLFVVAQSALPLFLVAVGEGIDLWASRDGGETWSGPQRVLTNPPATAALPYYFAPRIKAGRGGLLVLATDAALPDGSQVGSLIISHDDGLTWSGPAYVHHYSTTGANLNDPIAVAPNGDVSAIYGDFDGAIVGYRSADQGATWNGPQSLAAFPGGTEPAWVSTVSGPDGSVIAEYRSGSNDPPRFAAGLVRWKTAGTIEQMSLVDVDCIAGERHLGDDYGAVAVGSDNTVWAAWSDPRDSESARILLARTRGQ